MKFECPKEKFTKAFSKIEKVSSRGSSNPILKCVLLEGKDHALVMRATNLDIGIEVTLPIKLEEDGVVAVTSSILGSFVSQSDKEKSFKFEKKDETLNVFSEHYSASLKLLAPEDFPILPRPENTETFSISSKDLIKGLRAVVYSASVSTIKPELASVYIYPEEDELVFVATDSFRLAEKRVKLKSRIQFDKILIPFKNVTDIARILEEKDENIDVSFDKNQVSFSTPDFYLVSRTVDGNFPSYKQIVPKESKTEVVVLKQDLVNTLKVSHVFSDTFNRVTFVINPEEKVFEIKTKNNDIGENTSKLGGSLTGEPVQMSFSYKNIFDCFQSIDSDSVTLSFDGISRPLVITGVGDRSFFYLVMPMNK